MFLPTCTLCLSFLQLFVCGSMVSGLVRLPRWVEDAGEAGVGEGICRVALAEWLRRVPAKYMGFPRKSSNLLGDGYIGSSSQRLCPLLFAPLSLSLHHPPAAGTSPRPPPHLFLYAAPFWCSFPPPPFASAAIPHHSSSRLFFHRIAPSIHTMHLVLPHAPHPLLCLPCLFNCCKSTSSFLDLDAHQ